MVSVIISIAAKLILTFPNANSTVCILSKPQTHLRYPNTASQKKSTPNMQRKPR